MYRDNREWFFKVKMVNEFIEEHKSKHKLYMNWYKKRLELEKIEENIIKNEKC